MVHIRLLDADHVEVQTQSREDVAALRTAFRAAIGAELLDVHAEPDVYPISIESYGNICALWACGFQWEPSALEAVVSKLLPLAQRKAAMRSAFADAQQQDKQGAGVVRSRLSPE